MIVHPISLASITNAKIFVQEVVLSIVNVALSITTLFVHALPNILVILMAQAVIISVMNRLMKTNVHQQNVVHIPNAAIVQTANRFALVYQILLVHLPIVVHSALPIVNVISLKLASIKNAKTLAKKIIHVPENMLVVLFEITILLALAIVATKAMRTIDVIYHQRQFNRMMLCL
jgi:hypothetical protein